MSRQRVWMIGTAATGKGGIASVLQQYAEAGLLDEAAVHFEPSHNDIGLGGRILPFIRCASRLWPALLLGNVSVLHAHTSYGGSFWRKLLLVLPALAMHVPVIVHLHAGSFVEYHANGGAWRKFWMRFLFRRVFRVVVLSAEWKRWAQVVEPGVRATVIPNSMASTTGTYAGAPEQGRPRILFLGRIGAAKGIFDLLRALVIVRQSIPAVHLVVGGDGDIDQLRAEVDTLGLRESVEYAGWVTGAAKSQLLRDCWVFALPSYKEGLPMGIIEAMAYARAVVASPVGGVASAVEHGVTGFLVEAGEVDALAANLKVVLSSHAEAQRLGQSGRQAFARTFSHEVNLPKILALYREAGAAELPVLNLPHMDDS